MKMRFKTIMTNKNIKVKNLKKQIKIKIMIYFYKINNSLTFKILIISE